MAGKGSEVVDVRYERIKIDDDRYKAILFVIGGEEVWLPRAHIEVDRCDSTVACPTWLAEKKGTDGEVV